MAKEISHLHIKLSPKLKQQFEELCDADEIDMSTKVREIIANLVRARKRQSGKTDEETHVTDSKPVSKAAKGTTSKVKKTA